MRGPRSIPARVAGVVVGAVLLLPASPLHGEESRMTVPALRPNVVVITVTCLRRDHLGFSGYPRTTSPAADELARSSFVFTNAFSSAGYTMPDMMTLFTSLEPDSHDVMDAFKDRLSPRVKTLAEVFRENGYLTAGFWVHELPHLSSDAGFDRGLDLVGDLDKYLAGRKALLEWLGRDRENPFFLWINARTAHPPYIPLPPWQDSFQEGTKRDRIETNEEFLQATYLEIVRALRTPGSSLYGAISPDTMARFPTLFDGRYQEGKLPAIESLVPPRERRRLANHRIETYFHRFNPDDPENLRYLISLYDACLLSVDQELVRPLLALLRKRGDFERTVIVFTADHGTAFNEHGACGPSPGFHEEVIHVPLVIKVPGSAMRKDIDALVQGPDLMPTLLDLCRLPIPPQAQGKSLVPLMEGREQASAQRELFGQSRLWASLRTRDDKLIVWRGDLALPFSVKDELYDLAHDPGEKVNLRERQPDEYQAMRERIRGHLAALPRYQDQVRDYPDDIDEGTRKRIRETGYW